MSSIVCIGNAGIDLIAPPTTQWPTRRGSWRMVENELEFKVGGCGFDTAVGLAKLGAKAKLVCGIGRGGHGQLVRQGLEACGVSLDDACVHPSLRTPLEFLVKDEAGKPSALHFAGASAHVDASLLTKLHEAGHFDDCSAIHLAGMGLLPAIESADFIHALVRILTQTPCCELSVDVSLREARTRDEWHAALAPLFATGCVHVFSPNYEEACQIHGIPRSATIPDSWAEDFRAFLLESFDTHGRDMSLVLRDGARGSVVIDPAGRGRVCRTEAVEHIADLSSAGEAWWAGFLVSRRMQRERGDFDRSVSSLAEAVRFGHRVATRAIQYESSQGWDLDDLRS